MEFLSSNKKKDFHGGNTILLNLQMRNLPQGFINRKCNVWGKNVKKLTTVYPLWKSHSGLQADKKWKDSTQFLMGLHLDAMVVRKHALERSLLLRHTPEWWDNWEEQPHWRTWCCKFLQCLKFHAGAQSFKTRIIRPHCTGIYAKNDNICLATSPLMFCIYSLYWSSLLFFSISNPFLCSTNECINSRMRIKLGSCNQYSYCEKVFYSL